MGAKDQVSNDLKWEKKLKKLKATITTCEITVKKRKNGSYRIWYNGYQEVGSLQNDLKKAKKKIQENSQKIALEKDFVDAIKAFKKKFYEEIDEYEDINLLSHKDLVAKDSETGEPVKLTPEILDLADLFIAMHRSHTIYIHQLLKEERKS